MKKNIIRFFIYSFVLTAAAAASWLLIKEEIPRSVVSFAEASSTSMDYRYDNGFQKTLQKYGLFRNVYEEKYSTPIPGLVSTDVLGNVSNQMVPQGICIAGEYMLVSAYDNIELYAQKTRKSDYEVNHSVLYVLSNENPAQRRLLTTIVLPDINHVGGVAFDGENVWIAKSTTKKCSVISYETIQAAVKSGMTSYQLKEYEASVDCGAVASFITFHDNLLWVGTYSNYISGKGTLRSYEIIKGEALELKEKEELLIPGFANGVAFMEKDGSDYMAVSTSRGRYFDSSIYLYRVVEEEKTGKNLYYCYDSYEFPPMAEELICDGENTYMLFESSATCYSTITYQKCSYPVDRICALSTEDMFSENLRTEYRRMEPSIGPLHSCATSNWYFPEEKYWEKYVA